MWRGRPSGVVTIERLRDPHTGDKGYMVLRISQGRCEVNAMNAPKRGVGTLTPRGELHHNLPDGFVEQSQQSIAATMQEVSTDHLLFETRFETNLRLAVQYHCRLLGEP